MDKELKDTIDHLDREIALKRHQDVSERQDVMIGLLAKMDETFASLQPSIDDGATRTAEAVASLSDDIKGMKIETPLVTVNVPDVVVPEIKIPEIVIPTIATPIIPEIKIPEIKLPTINVPKPQVTVNVPEIKIPKIVVPKIEMPDRMVITGDVGLKDVDKTHPLPVTIVDANGMPVGSSGGSGKADHFTIKAFGQSAFSVPVNSDGEVRVAGSFTAGAVTSSYVIAGNAEMIPYNSDNPFPVYLTSGAGGTSATNVIDSSGVPYTGSNPFPVYITSGGGATSATNIIDSSGVAYSGSNPIPITGTVTTGGLTDTQLRASHIDVVQMSGSIDSVYVTGVTGTIGVVTINPDGLPVYGGSSGGGLTDAELRASHLDVVQMSGTIDSVFVTNTVTVGGTVAVSGVTGSIGATILNGEGVARDTWGSSQVGTWNIASVTNSIAANIVDSSGVAYTTSNPLPIGDAGGSITVDGTVAVSGVTGSIGATILNGEGLARDSWLVSNITSSVQASLIDSTGIQYSGSNPVPITWVSGAGVSTSVNISDSTGVGYSGSNPLPVTGTVVVSSVTASTASALVDSTGVQFSGSNPVPTKEIRSATGTNTSVADNAASVTILASNTSRLGATVYNDSSAILYLLLGSTAASTTNYSVKVASSGYYEVPFGYTGQLTGIWATDPGDGAARVTEIT